MGVLGYTGDEARAMTLAEFVLAFEGYKESRGVTKSSDRMVSRNEFLDIVSKYGG